MHINKLNPWVKLHKFIADNILSKTIMFSPLYGLGDRITFYSFLSSFALKSEFDVKVICLNNKKDPLLDFFDYTRNNFIVAPEGISIPPIELTHWIYGCDKPTPGNIFFTWHWAFADSTIAEYFERNCEIDKNLTHKNLVKKILALPESTNASLINVANQCDETVILCPETNTIGSPPLEWWGEVAEHILTSGLSVLVNASKDETKIFFNVLQKRLSNLDLFEGNLQKLTELIGRSLGTISARSGLCEVIALTNKSRYITVSNGHTSRFWALGEGFGRAPQRELVYSEQSHFDTLSSVSEIVNDWGREMR